MGRARCNFSVAVYKLTTGFPREELYGLSNQLRRAQRFRNRAISRRDTAEARLRSTCCTLLSMARGSAFEVEAQLLLARELRIWQLSRQSARCESLCDEVSRMLRSMMRALKEQSIAG